MSVALAPPAGAAARGGIAGTNDTAGARRIGAAFAAARSDGRVALVPYVVAGYPDAATSLRIAIAAIDAGADLLEVGLPYSDPLADGATLQRASQVALAAGATLEGSLRLIEDIAAAGRLEVEAATDGEAFEAMRWLSRTEGILPALESAHALAVLPRLLARSDGAGWPEETVVLVGLSGRGDKDLASFGRWLEDAER